jgi:hypothetical protein
VFEIAERQAALLARGLGAYTDFSAQIGGNVAEVGAMLVASSMGYFSPRVFVFRK